MLPDGIRTRVPDIDLAERPYSAVLTLSKHTLTSFEKLGFNQIPGSLGSSKWTGELRFL